MGETDRGRPLKTLDTALGLVDAVEANEGATIPELASELDLARSTIHGYVTTLERARYLVREGDEYHLGMAFLEKGGHVRLRNPSFRTVFPVVETLAEETGERAQFIVEEHGRGTYVHSATGDNAVQTDARIGKPVNLHASSAGKAILARLPADRVDQIVDRHGLPEFTDNTITEHDALDAELAEIRDRGYAVSDEESITGLRAVGAAVVVRDEVVGGISISGPAHRLKNDRFHERLPDLLLGATNELQLRLEYE
jgi:DNA-binding IclR family transcriptional regulator